MTEERLITYAREPPIPFAVLSQLICSSVEEVGGLSSFVFLVSICIQALHIQCAAPFPCSVVFKVFIAVHKMSSIYPTIMPHHTELAKASAVEAEKSIFKTAPFDPRFPNQNLTRYCYQSYLDFQKCKQFKGEEYEACQYFKGVIKSICPKAWLEKWDTQVEEGVFVGRI